MMKKLTLFAKILVLLFISGIVFGTWWLYKSIFIVNKSQVLLNLKTQKIISDNKYVYFFNCFKYNIKKINTTKNIIDIPILLQVSNGKKYCVRIKIIMNVNKKFFITENNPIEYIMENIQYDIYDYTSTLEQKSIFSKRIEIKKNIQTIIQNKISKDLIQIKEIKMDEITKVSI